MKRKTYVLIAGAVVAVVAIYFAKSLLHDGLSSHATPTKLETVLARNAHYLSIPASARSTPNPIPSSAEVLHGAAMHFADHCAICHGNDGSGDTMVGRGLYPKPPDLRQQQTQKLSDGELFWIIENGVRFTGMPAFSSHGLEDESWKLVHFIRRLPQQTADERMEMERNNPKGPDDRAEEQDENDFLAGKPQEKKDTKPLQHHDH
ncbi:MAG TPA: cytochrome c [Candidatus Saccharimonadales bacterium]|nr:cytochrome c [Candidatus Saccharimonadales bacterium]